MSTSHQQMALQVHCKVWRSESNVNALPRVNPGKNVRTRQVVNSPELYA